MSNVFGWGDYSRGGNIYEKVIIVLKAVSIAKLGKGLFRVKNYVPVQTIVSPYDANCVTPLIYPTADLDFLFGIIVSFDLSFYFLFFETCTQPFCKRHYPVIVFTITRHVLYTGKCTRLYILEIIKA